MRRLWLVVLAVGSCKLGDALNDYCLRTLACRCDGGECCVLEGNTCNADTPCCSGSCVMGQCRATAAAGGGGGSSGGMGGGTAGGTAGGGVGGGGAGGGSDGGDSDGGGLDAGAIFGASLPYCTPTAAPGSLSIPDGCCRDYECATGQCLGFPFTATGGRRCTPLAAREIDGGTCGDETDCIDGLTCDLRFDAGRCVRTFQTRLGGGLDCLPDDWSNERQSCALLWPDGGAAGVFCYTPGSRVPMGGGPCCSDRSDGGAVASCTETGSCTCNGSCATQYDYVCPL